MDFDRLQRICQALRNPAFGNPSEAESLLLQEMERDYYNYANLLVTFLENNNIEIANNVLISIIIKRHLKTLPSDLFLRLFQIFKGITVCSLLGQQEFKESLCDSLGSVMTPEQIPYILQEPPSIDAMTILNVFLFRAGNNNFCDKNQEYAFHAFQYIQNSFKTINNIDLLTVTSSNLACLCPFSDELIMTVLDYYPISIENLPWQIELLSAFEKINDSELKLEKAINKFSEIMKLPFEEPKINVVRNAYSLEIAASQLFKAINWTIQALLGIDDNQTFRDVIQLALPRSVLPDYTKKRWSEDIDVFFNENLTPDGFDEGENFRYDIFTAVSQIWTLGDFYTFMTSQCDQDFKGDENFQEALFYFTANFLSIGIIPDFKETISEPINQNNEILVGQYLRCIVLSGRSLDKNLLEYFLHCNSSIIQFSLISAISKKPEIYIDYLSECARLFLLYSKVITTPNIHDFYEIIGNLIITGKNNIDEECTLYFIDQILNSICTNIYDQATGNHLVAVISDFADNVPFLPILQAKVFPVVKYIIANYSSSIQGFLLCSAVLNKLPVHNSISAVILDNYLEFEFYHEFLSKLNYINEDFSSRAPFIFLVANSISAFYCRCNKVSPIMAEYLINFIQLTFNKTAYADKSLTSLIYEFLIAQSNDLPDLKLNQINIIMLIGQYITNEKNQNNISVIEVFFSGISLAYTQDSRLLNELFIHAQFNFLDVYSYILKNINFFDLVESDLFIAMIIISVKINQQNIFPQEFLNCFSETYNLYTMKMRIRNESPFIDQKDPFLMCHKFLTLDREKLNCLMSC